TTQTPTGNRQAETADDRSDPTQAMSLSRALRCRFHPTSIDYSVNGNEAVKYSNGAERVDNEWSNIPAQRPALLPLLAADQQHVLGRHLDHLPPGSWRQPEPDRDARGRRAVHRRGDGDPNRRRRRHLRPEGLAGDGRVPERIGDAGNADRRP